MEVHKKCLSASLSASLSVVSLLLSTQTRIYVRTYDAWRLSRDHDTQKSLHPLASHAQVGGQHVHITHLGPETAAAER